MTIESVYIATDGARTFTEHRTTDDGATTVCSLRYSDWPDIDPKNPDMGKDWFYDHDRKDVQPCVACGVTAVTFVGAYGWDD